MWCEGGRTSYYQRKVTPTPLKRTAWEEDLSIALDSSLFRAVALTAVDIYIFIYIATLLRHYRIQYRVDYISGIAS